MITVYQHHSHVLSVNYLENKMYIKLHLILQGIVVTDIVSLFILLMCTYYSLTEWTMVYEIKY